MAEQIISPGVFTRENDLSFLPQGIGSIGAAIVGPTVQGPAFVPTLITNFSEYERIFGPLSPETFVPQTVREYLRSAGSVTVCRILGGSGYTYTNGTNETIAIGAFPSGSTTGILLGVIFPSKDTDAQPDLKDSIFTNASSPTSMGASGSISTISGSTYITSGSNAGFLHLTLSGSSVTTTNFTASINPQNNNYWAKVLGSTPNNSKTGIVTYDGTPGYTELNFKSVTTSIIADLTGGVYDSYGLGNIAQSSGSIIQLITQSADLEYSGLADVDEGYSYASTPFIQAGKSRNSKDLFRFHTISHGDEMNNKYKISIANLREISDVDGVEQYTTFSVILRKCKDVDKSPSILEQYNNLSLDPDAPNYIARKIGDRYPQYNQTLDKVELLGNYPNVSNYIRVEMDPSVEARSTSPKLSPLGFEALINPINANVFPTLTFPSASYEGIQQTGTDGIYNSKGYLGWKGEEKAIDNNNFLKPLPTSQTNNCSGPFNVEDYSGHPSSSFWTGSLAVKIDSTGISGPTANQLKFTVPFQGGTDGIPSHRVIFTGNESTLATSYDLGTNLYGFDLSSTTTTGYKAYKKALDILSNQDEYDINMLVLPGVIHELHPAITNKAIDMVETRGDAFYVMDLATYNTSINSAVNIVDGLDTNYAAVYYPWVKVLDTSINKPVLVPPSVIVPGAIAASDAIAAEWFAPAGLNRGVLGNVIEAKMRLNQAERDALYDAKINPIATFPSTGVCIWGQKTLQERASALDRINVRRLLIALKKFIGSSAKYLVFEQNTASTRNRFLNIVNPYLESVQQRQGLYAFRVQMDELNNTAAEIDRNQLVGAIYLQPTKTAEFIILDFNVLPTGATFDS